MNLLPEDSQNFEEVLGSDVAKEQRLHQVVAASAFVLALAILPVANYFLGSTALGEVAGVATVAPTATYGAVNPQNVTSTNTNETGQVAGVSTEDLRTLGSADENATSTSDLLLPADPAECEIVREQRITELRTWSEGYKKAKLATFDAKVKPYRDALQQNPEMKAADKTALDEIISNEYKPYLQSLATAEAAVSDKQQALERATCGNAL